MENVRRVLRDELLEVLVGMNKEAVRERWVRGVGAGHDGDRVVGIAGGEGMEGWRMR